MHEPALSVHQSCRAPRPFFARDPATLARVLIGQRLVRMLDDGTRLAGTIVETEAYLGIRDAAAHSFGGRRTPRNDAMYAQPGTLYVYFTYGMHHCMNVVCGMEGEPVAVLLRAIEPTEGLETMQRLRQRKQSGGGAASRMLSDRDLCRGPARLCQAMDIDRRHNLIDLTTDSRLWIEIARPGAPPARLLGNTARIGVGYAGPWAARRLRWFLKASMHVSGASGTGVNRNAAGQPRQRAKRGKRAEP